MVYFEIFFAGSFNELAKINKKCLWLNAAREEHYVSQRVLIATPKQTKKI